MDLASISPFLETLSEGLIVISADLDVIGMNNAAEEILGPGCEGLFSLPVKEGPQNTRVKQAFKQTISAVRPMTMLDSSFVPFGTYRSDGKVQLREPELPVLCALRGEQVKDLELVVRNKFKPEGVRLTVTVNPVKNSAGSVLYAVCAFSDISAAHVSEQRHNIFRQVFAQTQEAIVITDGAFIVQYANQSYWELMGNSPDKILNLPFAPQQEDCKEGLSWKEMQEIVKRDGRWSGEFVIRRRSNELLPLWATLHSVVDSDRRVTNYVLTLSDLTSLKSSQEELYRLVSKDTLTGLSNRREFLEELEKTIERSARANEKFGLLFLDLLRFKDLNDSLGHQVGDRVLQTIASRLSQLRKEDDVIGRLGADDFAILISDCANDMDFAMAIEEIRKAIETPIAIGEHLVNPSACIGVTFYPDDGADAATLVKNVDVALATATAQGSAQTRFFTQRMFKVFTKHFWLENNLRNSFGKNQLLPYFQPQLNLQNNKPEEAEVLIRWIHPEIGMISPGEFIPVAERTGLIGPLTSEILEASCRHLVTWKAQGMPLVCIAINVTPDLLLGPEFVPSLFALIERHKLNPSDILIEITESSAMADPDKISGILKQLKSHGLTLAIDDFGTGYSSLAYLRKFAVDQIKIDQSFVKELATSHESRTIVKAIVRMCETLGFETLAEGVETPEQLKILAEYGCKKLQGYLIAKPLSAADYHSFMVANGNGMNLLVTS